MKFVVTLFSVKARLKLNPKKLYYADEAAVPELIKIAAILYKASNAKSTE